LQVIKLISKRVEVKKEVKGQGERTFTKITTNSLLGLMHTIKFKRKLQLLLPFQINTNLQGSFVNKINEKSKLV
jgi:hypothetical protein